MKGQVSCAHPLVGDAIYISSIILYPARAQQAIIMQQV